MRKVKARLLKLNDILDGNKSDSDSSEYMKAHHVPSNLPEVKPIVLPPPLPVRPLMPPPIPKNGVLKAV
jgi:hypothetical protein